MIDFFDAFNQSFNQAEVIEVIQSEDQEKKFKLALQIIFDTNISDLGWGLLKRLDIKSFIDEKFIKDFLYHSSPKLTVLRVFKFLDFVVKQNSETLNMAIQKHLAVYAQKPVEQATSEYTLSSIVNIIQILEQHNSRTNIPTSAVLTVILRQMTQTPLPREAISIANSRIDVNFIAEFFKNVQLSEQDRFQLLPMIFSHIMATSEPQPLIVLGLLIIPEQMMNRAIEYFFACASNGRSGHQQRQSIILALTRMISWQRTLSDLQLDQWISRALSMLNSTGYGDVVDELAHSTMTPAFITLVIPIFQCKMLKVVQALLENAKSTKEIFDLIERRCVTLLKKLEDTKSDIFEPLMEVLCETLCRINQTELRYRDLIQFLETKNRSPSNYISKRAIGPSYLSSYLSNNARVGLENLGNSCYLNCILQALFMTKQFCREILVTQRFEERSVVALQELFALMLFSPRPEQNPKKVVNLIRPNDFLPGVQQDSSEFLGSLLERLHEIEKKRMKDDQGYKMEEDWDNEETLTADEGSNSASSNEGTRNSSDSGIQSMENDTPSPEVKNESGTETMNESKDKIVDNTQNLYQTYIQRIFGGKISTRILCSSCNGNSINIDTFRDLQLSFPEKNKDEIAMGDTQYNIQQLLEFYFTTEELTLLTDNQYHCDNCKIHCNGIRCTEILEPPRNLILTLKHFHYDYRQQTRSKLLYKVFHDELISVTVKENFASNCSKIVEYVLYAAVIHSGTSLDSGHYYTIAREDENKWFKFNDSFVTKSSLDELRSLICPNTPYILFYQRVSNASSTIVSAESASTSSSQSFNENIFPNYEELSSILKTAIEDDKMNCELMRTQHNIQHTVIPSRYNPDDDRDSSGSSGFNSGMDVPRFIY